jgi:hypothetical protein
MKQFIKEFVKHFINVFFIMIFCTFALVLGVTPLILAEVYSGWYLLLYFVTIPTFFAICAVLDM